MTACPLRPVVSNLRAGVLGRIYICPVIQNSCRLAWLYQLKKTLHLLFFDPSQPCQAPDGETGCNAFSLLHPAFPSRVAPYGWTYVNPVLDNQQIIENEALQWLPIHKTAWRQEDSFLVLYNILQTNPLLKFTENFNFVDQTIVYKFTKKLQKNFTLLSEKQ